MAGPQRGDVCVEIFPGWPTARREPRVTGRSDRRRTCIRDFRFARECAASSWPVRRGTARVDRDRLEVPPTTTMVPPQLALHPAAQDIVDTLPVQLRRATVVALGARRREAVHGVGEEVEVVRSRRPPRALRAITVTCRPAPSGRCPPSRSTPRRALCRARGAASRPCRGPATRRGSTPPRSTRSGSARATAMARPPLMQNPTTPTRPSAAAGSRSAYVEHRLRVADDVRRVTVSISSRRACMSSSDWPELPERAAAVEQVRQHHVVARPSRAATPCPSGRGGCSARPSGTARPGTGRRARVGR